MKTKPIPAIIMLMAGFITCVVGILTHIETVRFAKILLLVLFVFYVFGCIVKMIVDNNFKEVEETTEGTDVSVNDEEDGEQKQEQEQSEEQKEQ